MKVYCYAKCGTCKKALRWLEENGIAYEGVDIQMEHPDEATLRRCVAQSGLPLKRFFNTSGQAYRALELTRRLPAMGEDEQYGLLAADGMLVKRPLVVGGDFVLVGFQEEQWRKTLL